MINVIRDSFASDVKKLRSKVDASVPFNKSGRASLNGDLPKLLAVLDDLREICETPAFVLLPGREHGVTR